MWHTYLVFIVWISRSNFPSPISWLSIQYTEQQRLETKCENERVLLNLANANIFNEDKWDYFRSIPNFFVHIFAFLCFYDHNWKTFRWCEFPWNHRNTCGRHASHWLPNNLHFIVCNAELIIQHCYLGMRYADAFTYHIKDMFVVHLNQIFTSLNLIFVLSLLSKFPKRNINLEQNMDKLN